MAAGPHLSANAKAPRAACRRSSIRSVDSTSDAPEWTFYSSFISDARRLPNGNTLINEGMNGRFFQITPAGEIVWE